MTDNFCYSVLKTATLQIIQSAGFDSAYREPVETLTDVLGKYIEVLGSTVSSYANLSGRTTGTAYDVMNAMRSDLEPHVLKNWLEEEGKSLSPCWSAQSDPSRILEGIVRSGRPNDEAIEYLYGTSSIAEFNTLEGQDEEEGIDSEESSEDSPSDNINSTVSLPDYIPNYFPPFPEIIDDTAIITETNLLLHPDPPSSSSMPASNNNLPIATANALSMAEMLPPPVIVKKKKKPIENPFTFIVPFEESDLGTSEDQTNTPLSLSLTSTSSNKHLGKRKASDLSNHEKEENDALLSALQTINKPKYKLGQGLIGKGDQVFQIQTEMQAAPGNNLFNRDIGTFDNLVRNIAPPLVVSKLSTPNLYMDMLSTNSTPTTPSTSSHHQQQQNDLVSFSVPSSPQNTVSSTMTSPSSETPKLTKSSSMLAALANGPTTPINTTTTTTTTTNTNTNTNTTTNTKKQSLVSKKLAKDPTAAPKIPKTKVPKTPKIPKVPKLPKSASLPSVSSKAAKDPANDSTSSSNSTDLLSATTTTMSETIAPEIMTASIPLPTKKTKIPSAITTTVSEPTHQSITLVQSPMIPTPTPISLNSLSNTQKKKEQLTPEQLQQLKLQKQQQKLQRQQLKQQKLKQEQDEKKKVPKLMLNISQPTPSSIQSESPSPSTPKIRFKVKAPPIAQPSQPASSGHQQAEVIHCLCENPTVDYGTFMIACDNCSVWFHGSCVGIAEDDQVEEWYCRRCRA